MVQRIQWKLDVRVPGGPTLGFSKTLNVEAYDVIEVTLSGSNPGPADADKAVDIQPGGAGQIQFLLLTATEYSADLTYKVNTGSTEVALDQPQLFAGEGALSITESLGGPGDDGVKQLLFTNGLVENVSVKIIVGRDATPTP